MRSATLFALGASFSATSAVFQGFNYGATKTDGSFMFQQDFEAKFANAKNLVGTSGFTSARLYTMIQGGSSTNEPTQAIPAAINQGVTLLLGLWASAGDGDMQAEITALKSAITQYGTAFTSLVAGISVGSEDLYRNSPTGIAALSGAGANPADIVKYIGEVRSALQGTALSGAAIGHVDTWTSWVNASNNDVAAACDWIGMDAYPYFQNTMANDISSGKQLFDDALSATQAAVNGKPVWVTETGWPVSGKTEGQGVPSTANAQTYWQQVGCPLFGNVNTWWFTMQDADPTTPNPSFGLVGSTLSTTPLYDLSCNAASSSGSAQVTSSTVAASGPAASSGAASSGSSSSAEGGNGQASQSGQSSQPSSINQVSQASQAISPSVAPSIIASLSSAAAGSTLVTGGSGLGPSQGVPVVSNPSATPTGTGGGVSPSAPSVAAGNGSSPASPTLSSSPGSSTGGSSAGAPSVAPNAAAVLSAGPLFAAAGLFVAALAVL